MSYLSIAELLILAVGVSMDALAVAICKGLSIQKLKLRHAIIVGLWFGAFQALMPTIGWLLGSAFTELITSIDHWVAFVLLGIIGGNMVREALSRKEDDEVDPSLAFGAMFVLAIATSIDALAVGVTLALLNVNILATVLSIGLCTFIISTIGVKIGNVFGMKFKSKAELLGGVVLILIGLKILLEHLGIIAF
jgi:putative Mn2+ efflux pump MntP